MHAVRTRCEVLDIGKYSDPTFGPFDKFLVPKFSIKTEVLGGGGVQWQWQWQRLRLTAPPPPVLPS